MNSPDVELGTSKESPSTPPLERSSSLHILLTRCGARVLLGMSSDLTELRQQAAECTACELYLDATQTVFGSGRSGASMMLVGEQPGDREDLAGKPFVGPAGRVLNQALERAGVARSDAYVTNVVKHFRFRREGKACVHRAPGVEHVRACVPFRLTRHRGEVLEYRDLPLVATIHPSAVLRGPKERQAEMLEELVAGLELAGRTTRARAPELPRR
jgi:uracil-DNA glycosylase